jgi:hypothetical protein
MSLPRMIVAFLVAPATAPLAVFVLLSPFSLSGAVFPAVVAAAVSYALAFTLGLAAHLLLARTERAGLIAYAGSGFAIAAMVAASLFIFMEISWEQAAFALGNELPRMLILSFGFGMLGGLNGLVFWAILRPDRKAVT